LFDNFTVKSYILDTMELAKKLSKTDIPDRYSLSVFYTFCTGLDIEGAHWTMSEVRATTHLLKYNEFWKNRGSYIYKIDDMGNIVNPNNEPTSSTRIVPNDDSDTGDNDAINSGA
jgi:hypothetical protein